MFFVFCFLFTETSIFSVEGVFLYPEGRPCAVKTWKFPINIGCLLQLYRNEALQLLDDSHQPPCLISGVVHDKEYPLILFENSSSGTIITILPSRLKQGFWWGEKCLRLFWSTFTTRHSLFAHAETYYDMTHIRVESFIYLIKGAVAECGEGKPKWDGFWNVLRKVQSCIIWRTDESTILCAISGLSFRLRYFCLCVLETTKVMWQECMENYHWSRRKN